MAGGYTFVEYNQMTPEQQQAVREHLVCKSLPVEYLPNCAFAVNADGTVRRQKGRHVPSAAYAAELERKLAEWKAGLNPGIPADPAKGGIRHFLSGARFNFSNK